MRFLKGLGKTLKVSDRVVLAFRGLRRGMWHCYRCVTDTAEASTGGVQFMPTGQQAWTIREKRSGSEGYSQHTQVFIRTGWLH